MGTYRSIRVDLSGPEEDLEKVANELGHLDAESDEDTIHYVWAWSEPTKWLPEDSDLRRISMAYPKVVFRYRGRSDYDSWDLLLQSGKFIETGWLLPDTYSGLRRALTRARKVARSLGCEKSDARSLIS